MLLRVLIGVLILLSFTASARAQILPAEPGRRGCWRRIYDARHLSSHPRQTVAEMTFFLRVKAYDAKGNEVAHGDHVFHNFALAVKRRGEASARVTSGDCSGETAMQCAVDCDGGGAKIERAPKGDDGLVLRLEGEGVAFGNDCDTQRGTFLAPGVDDKIFRLEAEPIAACAALEREALGK